MFVVFIVAGGRGYARWTRWVGKSLGRGEGMHSQGRRAKKGRCKLCNNQGGKALGKRERRVRCEDRGGEAWARGWARKDEGDGAREEGGAGLEDEGRHEGTRWVARERKEAHERDGRRGRQEDERGHRRMGGGRVADERGRARGRTGGMMTGQWHRGGQVIG